MKSTLPSLPPQAFTDQILAYRSAHQRFYPTPGEEFWVSSRSKWTDPRWILDNQTIGTMAHASSVVWDLDLPDGTNMLDPVHAALLDEMRRFVWGCCIDPRNAKALAPGSMNAFNQGIRALLYWMIKKNYHRLHELDERAPARFVEDLQEYVGRSLERNEFTDDEGEYEGKNDDEGEDIGIPWGWIAMRLTPWRRLWNQRFALQDAGVEPPNTGEPFGGKSIKQQSEEMATGLGKKIPPLPDILACEIMNAADCLLEAAGNDMIRVARELSAIRNEVSEGGAIWNTAKQNKAAESVRNIEFGSADGHNAYWHPDKDEFDVQPTTVIRGLVEKVLGAAANLIHAETGMRASEVCSLQAGINPDTGLPSCISIRPSRSGMLDLFYITGKLSKMRAAPEETEWLLAARPRGADIKPSIVRAIEIVQHLLAPWRDMATDPKARDALFLTWGANGFPVTGDEIEPMNIKALSAKVKAFASAFIDWDALPDDPALQRYKQTKGMCIRGHQWRKNYARFVFQVNPRMIPAVARQFKHLSIAMTENAYIGTDIDLIDEVAKENLNMTVDLLMQKARGKGPKHAGRLAKLMETYQSEIAKIIEGKSDSDARKDMEAWCISKNMKLFFHGYGSCIPGIAPTEAECHKRAKTVHWANDKPNYATRETSLCTGCYLFLAGEETKQYWLQRYEKNMTAWLHAKARGEQKQFHVAKARAEQSAVYLKTWDVELPKIHLDIGVEATNG